MRVVKIPITNIVVGGGYTGVIVVGSKHTPLNVLLDTGSSTLAVHGANFDPTTCPDTKTTNLAQTVQYGVGGWVGAVVQTAVGISADVTMASTPLAVTYSESANMFGGAHGILGLAYAALDSAYVMPADSWAGRYTVAQIEASPAIDLEPYFTQVERAGVVGNKFGFYGQRSAVSLATDDPETDPRNSGWLLLGGGDEATDLYTGTFTPVEVVHDVWYNTILLAVQVGTQPMVTATPIPSGSPLASNSIVDTGTNCVLLEASTYDAVIAAFHAIDPTFATALVTYAVGATAGIDHAQLEVTRWPDLHLVLQGHGGAPATLTISPDNYWQLDANRTGQALAYLCRGQPGGQTILGLPLLAGYYTVFDRSRDGAIGEIRFATRA
jgi:Eukaryotic aspartyl protease